MDGLPLAELLAIENDFERRMLLAALLQEALMRTDSHALLLTGAVLEGWQRRSRTRSVVHLLTDSEACVASQLTPASFVPSLHCFVSGLVGMVVHAVEIPATDCTGTPGLLDVRGKCVNTLEPFGKLAEQLTELLNERQDLLAGAVTQLVCERRRVYEEAGKLEFTGPRQRRYHLGQEKIVEYYERQQDA